MGRSAHVDHSSLSCSFIQQDTTTGLDWSDLNVWSREVAAVYDCESPQLAYQPRSSSSRPQFALDCMSAQHPASTHGYLAITRMHASMRACMQITQACKDVVLPPLAAKIIGIPFASYLGFLYYRWVQDQRQLLLVSPHALDAMRAFPHNDP